MPSIFGTGTSNQNLGTQDTPEFAGLTVHGDEVLTEAGGQNITDTLTTSQTVFTADQKLITKKYVDDSFNSETLQSVYDNSNVGEIDMVTTKDINYIDTTAGNALTIFADGDGISTKKISADNMLLNGDQVAIIDDIPTNKEITENETSYLSYEMVPRGARDVWTSYGVADRNGLYVYPFESLNILLSGGSGTRLSYSTDGGITWLLCTTPGLANPLVAIIYDSAISRFTGITLTTGRVWTSNDGITWTDTYAFPYSILPYMIKFNNLYIVGCFNPSYAAYSNDQGATWTLCTATRMVQRIILGKDDLGVDILVSSGFNGPSYSYDGINWVNGDIAAWSEAINYSSYRQEYIAIGTDTGTYYKSTNGKTWTTLSTSSNTNVFDLMYVEKDKNNIPIYQWYIAMRTGLNYTLFYSPNCSTGSFRNINMDGAGLYVSVTGPKTLLYLSTYDRFLITVNDVSTTKTFIRTADKTNRTAFNDKLWLQSAPKISGGTSNQFLKADGTIDSTAYAPLAGATFTNTITAPTIIKTGGKSGEFLKANGSSDNTNYTINDIPLGTRDIWTSNAQANTNGIYVSYITETDRVFTSSFTTGKISYSTDGGLTFTVSTTAGMTIATEVQYDASGMGTYIAITRTTNQMWRSVDGGATFSNTGAIPYIDLRPYFIIFNGIYIVPRSVVSEGIITSVDKGVNWVLQASATRIANKLKVGKDDLGVDIIVSSYTGGQMYSYDGLTWVNADINVNASSFCYSTYLQEWILIETSGITYRSLNGKNWTIYATVDTKLASNNEIFYLETDKYGGAVYQYYTVLTDTEGKYSLAFSPTALLNSWTVLKMQGAGTFNAGFEILYLSIYDRFLISINDSNTYIRTSQRATRPAFNDKTWHLQNRYLYDSFSQTADKTVGNTVTETSIIGTGVGTMTIQSSDIYIGEVYKLCLSGYMDVNLTPTMTWRLKFGETTIVTSVFNMLAIPANSGWHIEYHLCFRTLGVSGTCVVTGLFHYSDANTINQESIVKVGTTTVDTTINSLLNLTVQWGTANLENTITSQICTLTNE